MRALNMQALTNDLLSKYRGVTIYGLGDKAHQGEVSGHNPDDTPGVKAELQDSDNKPEYRSLDVMIGSAFTKADADRLVAAMVADADARRRLYYIIWNGYIWSRSHGWVKRKYTGSDQHTNHVHFSGWMDDDDNTASWSAVGSTNSGGEDDMFCEQGDNNEKVGALQVKLKNLGFYTGAVDNDYGKGTTAALKAACLKANSSTTADGTKYDKYTSYYVEQLMIQKYAIPSNVDLGPLQDRLTKLEKMAFPVLPANVVFTGVLKQG